MNFNDKKIVIFGCQQIAVDCIRDILKMGISIAAVVTYELPTDKVYGYASVYDIAQKNNITIYEPEKLNKNFINTIKKIKPDLILSIYYRKIFPKELIKIPTLGCVNIHPGLLPYYRGPIPTFWAVLNGEKKCGVTLHYIDEGIDTGPIINQEKIIIKDNHTGFTLNNEVMMVGRKLLIKNLPAILNKKVKTKPQKRNVGSYYGKFHNSLRLINWYKKNSDIYNQIRVMTKPYMGCLTIILDKDMIVWRAKLIQNKNHTIITPGKILKVYNNGNFLVSTSNGCIKITDYEILKSHCDNNYYIKKGRIL